MAQVRHIQQKFKRVVTLDGHRLGLVSGTVLALIVMALCFYVRDVDGFTAATRAGWTFVAGYGAVFFFVRVILRTTLFEFIGQRQPKKGRAVRLGRALAQDMPGARVDTLLDAAQAGLPADVLADLGVEHLGEAGVDKFSEEELAAHSDSGIERLGAAQLGPLSEGLGGGASLIEEAGE